MSDFLRPDFGLCEDLCRHDVADHPDGAVGHGLAVIVAVPLGLLAARNMSPVWIQQPVRRLLDLLRSVPDLVVGTLFIVAVGLGPFAGVLALAVNTGGVLGKLFSEAVEAIDPGPVEGCAPPAPRPCSRSSGG